MRKSTLFGKKTRKIESSQSKKMFVLNIDNYAYCVPFVETDTEIFLKTVFPSRKYTALYLVEPSND